MNANELKLRQQYWLQVRECLIRFHHFTQKEAEGEVLRLLKKLPLDSNDPSVELVYHVEPFRLACKVTGKRLSVKDFTAEYQGVLDETAFWTASGTSAMTVKDSILGGLKGLFRIDYLSKKQDNSSSEKRVRESKSETGGYSKQMAKPKSKVLKPVASSGKKSAASPKKANKKKSSNKPTR
jgi:hypothetical protein